MNRILFTFFIFSSLIGFTQNDVTLYETGIYKTFADFQNRIPNKTVEFTTHQLKNNSNIGYQLRDENNKRIKKSFAVSNGKTVFVKVKEMQKLIRKTQKAGTPLDSGWDYLPAIFMTNEILYFENFFAGVGKQIFGGKIYLTGIIYDANEKSFIVLNSNNKVNEFINKKFPNLSNQFDFKGELVDLNKVREMFTEIVSRN